MNSSRKDIMLYLSSFVLLAISAVFFVLEFLNPYEKTYYLLSVIFLIAFCIYYKIVSKKIMCDGGYNFLQAYIFYRKCVKDGVLYKSKGFEETDIEKMMEVAANYDFAKESDVHTLKKIYLNGHKTEKLFKIKN